jgi:hypothetical protein
VLAGFRDGIDVPSARGDLGHVTVNIPSIRSAVMSVCYRNVVNESFINDNSGNK